MSKEKLIKWIGISILILILSTILSVLLYIGPMIASVLTAIIIEKPKYNLSKKIKNKVYFLVLGIIGLVFSQFFILNVSSLTLVLNVLIFTLVFVGILLPNKK